MATPIPIPIDSHTYEALNQSILDIITSGNYAAISIFTDASGTVYHSDEFGDIDNRIVLSSSVTSSYIDSSGNPTHPFLVLEFETIEGYPVGQYIAYLTSTDDVDFHWYILTSVPVPAFTFTPS